MKLLSLLFLLIIAQLAFCQNSKQGIDSLNQNLEIQEGSELILSQIRLSSLIMTIDQQRTDSLLKVAMEASEAQGFMEGKIRTLLVQAAVANYKSNLSKSQELLKEAIDLSTLYSFEEGLAFAYTTLGSQLIRRGNYAEAIENHFKGVEYANKLGMTDVEVTNLLNIGLIKQRVGELDESENYLKQAIAICDKNDMQFRKAQLLINLGVMEFSRQNTGLSIDYHQEALSIFREFNDLNNTAVCLQNIGFAYASIRNKPSAFQYYDESIAIRREISDSLGIARILLNKGLLEKELGALNSAIRFGQNALEILKIWPNTRLQSDVYALLAGLYQEQKNFEKALEFHQKLSITKDSLQRTINQTRISELTAQFEFDKQDRELEISRQQLTLSDKKAELLRSRQILLMLAIVALLLIIIVLILNSRQKLSRQKLEKQSAQDRARISQLQEEKLNQELVLKSLELNSYADQLRQKNQMITAITRQIEELKNEGQKWLSDEGLKEISKDIDGRSGHAISWEEFRLKFDEVHTDFVKNLLTKFTNLTKNEIDLCILLKINLTHKEIAQLLNIEYESAKKSIQRLFRKLGFESSDQLRTQLIQI